MLIGLSLAALLIGAGLLLSDNSSRPPLSDNPQAARLCEEGSRQVQAYKFPQGAEKLQEALALDPGLAEAAISLAFAYGRLGRAEQYKRTLAQADSLTALIPDDNRRMLAQMRLGLRHNSRFSGMLDSLLTRLDQEQPDNIHVLVAKAERGRQKNDPQQQAKAWHRILERDPNFAEAYNRLGYLELNQGHYHQAVEHMKKYAFLAPDLANPHDSLGDVLMVMGQYEEAAREFRSAIALQPDFHYSYINLGKSYLYRGMIKTGLEIMDQVQTMVTGTKLGEQIDLDVLITYLEMDMKDEVNQMILTFLQRYPDTDNTAVFRAIRLAHLNRLDQSKAVMDSCLTNWRSQEWYQVSPAARASIQLAEKNYAAFVADLVSDPATRVRKWQELLEVMKGQRPSHGRWHAHIKLAAAFLDNGQPDLAMEQIAPILEVNNRMVPALVAAVRISLAQNDPAQARIALEQLKWSIQQSDSAYSGRIQARELESQLTELEKRS